MDNFVFMLSKSIFTCQYSTLAISIYIMDKFCLKWEEHLNNIKLTFNELRNDSDFSDVTLVCADGQQFDAHKVVLSAGSQFFKAILKTPSKKDPLIYMKGMTSSDVSNILDFLYHGEVNIYHDDIDNFLAIAEDIKLNGLNSSEYTKQKHSDSDINEKIDDRIGDKIIKFDFQQEIEEEHDKISSSVNMTVGVPQEYYYKFGDNINNKQIVIVDPITDDMNEKMNNMIQRNGETWSCTMCGKTGRKDNIKRHTEVHIEGLSYPCHYCDKSFRYCIHYSCAHINS